MTNKMPTNIHATREGTMRSGAWGVILDWVKPQDKTEYTLKHNNPEYHVIPKSDVDGDDLKRAIELTEANISTAELIAESGIESGLSRKMGFNTAKCHKTILAALISQSDPDTYKITYTWNDSPVAENSMRGKFIPIEDPDIVRIPRKVLERLLQPNISNMIIDELKGTMGTQIYVDALEDHIQAINVALNYREGDKK